MILSIVLIILVIVLDQLSKYLTLISLSPNDTFAVIEDVFHFTHIQNRGAAFGMLSSHRWLFMAVSVIGIVALFVWLILAKPQSKWTRIGVSFIIGGGIGNMIDRIVLGYVVDMIDCRFINFYVFNIADSFVCIGCAMVFIGLIREVIEENRQKKAAVKSQKGEVSGESRDE